MYPIFKEEALALLEKLRKIRKDTGEMIAFLEHYLQLHGEISHAAVHYNPDDYLERLAAQLLSASQSEQTEDKKEGQEDV